MSLMQYKFVIQQLQRKMRTIENKNPNYEQSRYWKKYKTQENMVYQKINELKGEQENGSQPNC